MKQIRIYWDTSDPNNVGWAWDGQDQSGDLDTLGILYEGDFIQGALAQIQTFYDEEIEVWLDK